MTLDKFHKKIFILKHRNIFKEQDTQQSIILIYSFGGLNKLILYEVISLLLVGSVSTI